MGFRSVWKILARMAGDLRHDKLAGCHLPQVLYAYIWGGKSQAGAGNAHAR
jgi:hypothetical protein